MERQYYDTVLDTIGNTPLVKLGKMNTGHGIVLAKLEYFNPGGSIKDRVAAAMIEDAEREGKLKPGGVIIESTSGNTGIGLALVAARKGYQLILTMPDTMSLERRKLLAAFGVRLELTSGSLGIEGANKKAEELFKDYPGAFMPKQFENPVNPNCHRDTTAEEIWRDTGGEIAAFVAAVGTGGTLTGVAKGLLAKDPSIRICAVEPADSPVLSGGAAGPHKLQGIGAGFIPKVMDRDLVNEIFRVTTEEAFATARAAARREGLLVGISSGASLYAALELSQRPEFEDRNIVVILPDTGERYLSSDLFSDLAT